MDRWKALARAGGGAVAIEDARGESRDYLVRIPKGRVRGLCVVLHPFGFEPAGVMDGVPAGDQLVRPLTGFAPVAAALGFATVAPRGRGRRSELVSLAWRDHLEAAWEVSRGLAAALRTDWIAAGGLSMGGLEALVLAGLHPEGVRAVWATNPVVDLTAWWADITEGRASPTMAGAAEQIREEVGGVPGDLPAEYERRSPLHHVTALAKVPVRLTWSPQDTIIPDQRGKHAHRLADELRARGGDVDEEIVTHEPTAPGIEAGRYAHEACSVWDAAGWLSTRCDEASTGA
jgi:pimeloyl-ACP methyl ester carboxylesterase